MGKICGIMRVEKRKRAAVYGLQIEANRTLADHMEGRDFDRSDIDWELTDQNVHLVHTENWNKEITRQLKEAGIKEITRGNNASVVLLDGLYTSSPEWFDSHSEEEARSYFNDCLEFHIEHFCGGDPSRVINCVIHLDETTHHMAVASIPILDTGEKLKLSAKDIMGNKSDYHHRQDSFYEEVSQKYGMERGEVLEEGELCLHTTKREWQIATQEERLAEVAEQAQLLEEALHDNEVRLMEQKAEIAKNNRVIDNQPHILTKAELREMAEEEKPVNKLTGKVSLSQDDYRSLLATKIEADSLKQERRQLNEVKEELNLEKRRIQDQKEDVFLEAKRQGLEQGSKEQQELVQKGKCFEELVDLAKHDRTLSESLHRALQPRIKKYPRLAKAVSEIFDWGKELVEHIRQSIKLKM